MKKTPTQARSEATIDAILMAASKLLFETGYERTTTNKIAEVAGVSIGSLYEYFPGKDAIFVEIRRREDNRLYEYEFELPATVRGFVRSHLSMYLRHVRLNLPLYKTLLKEVPRFVLSSEYYVDKRYIRWVAKLLDEHRNELNPCGEPTEMAEFITHVTMSTIDAYIMSLPEKLDDPVFEEMMANILERFLLKPHLVGA